MTTITRALQAEESLAAKLSEYTGEWVAIRDHEVVGHSETLRGLLDTIDPTEVDRILEVSEDPAVSCFF